MPEPPLIHDTWENFIREVLKFNPNADKNLIRKAFDFAHKVHACQLRASGEQYFVHPVETAKILTKLRADTATLCAALLHDIVEDSKVPLELVSKEFGEEIATLVEGVTKVQGVQFESKEEYSAENLRKVLLATTKDIRVMLIKLADRLHNMRTLKYFRVDKQKRIAQETLDIYAPIAHKLGIRFIKGDLEDLALKYLQPEIYKMLTEKISSKREQREKNTREFIRIILENLKKHNIEVEIEGRAKYFYSIYQKMKKQNKGFNEIYDLIAIRIITNTIPECYAALGVIHDLWKPVPGRFKDYIAVPKANGYQSLHTSVMGGHGRIVEIQIRTKDMHLIAEEGIAAHWRYKGTERDKKFDRKISWLKQILEWKQDSKTAKEFVESLKVDLFENEIVVFTPKGDPISLPEKATPIDFAYAVHTNIGNHCSKAEVNNKIVPLDHILRSGDIVHILTKNNAVPSRNWLTFVKSAKARSKIRSALNIKVDDRIKKGDEDEMKQNLLGKIEISGKQYPVKFSKCCSPEYGSPILSFLTKDKKITIHRKDCPNIAALKNERVVVVRWAGEEEKGIIKIRATVLDRVGLLADVLNVIADEKINLHSVNTRTRKGKVSITLTVKETIDLDLKRLISRIRSVDGVIDIKEVRK